MVHSVSDPHLSAADIAAGYNQLLEVEGGWRDMKQVIDLTLGTFTGPADTLRDLRAGHPAIAGSNVRYVRAVSTRVILSHHRAASGGCHAAWFTTVPGTRKALSLIGKGPYLRKLVAGAGFEPATFGL